MSQKERSKAWRRVISATRRKVNTAWWLERLAPLSIGFGILAASALLYLRTQPWFEQHYMPALIAASVTAVLLPLLALILGQRNFISEKEAAVRLDSVMGLNNALTVAEDEMGPWPSPPMKPVVRDGFGWNWRRLVIPPMIAVFLMGVAFLVPVRPVQAKLESPNEPIAWQEMEEWLEDLVEEEVSEEDSVEEIMEQIENLRDQAEEDWFSHSSLEATDSLRESLERTLGELQNDFETAERSLNALDKYGNAMSESARNQLMDEFQNALKGMEFSKLPPTPEVMEAMKQMKMDPQQMNQMNQQQMQQLQEALKKNAQALQEMMGQQGQQGMGQGMDDEEALMKMIHGENWKQGMQPGMGGVTRGRGDAPMYHNDDETDLKSKGLEGVTNDDFSRAAPGDLLGEGEVENNIEELPVQKREAGAVGSTGRGGEAVWEENLLPSERAVLERYFK